MTAMLGLGGVSVMTVLQPEVSAASTGLRKLETHTPTISGSAKVGNTLTAKPGAWTKGTKFAYRWSANGAAIASATAATLKLTSAQTGKAVTVRVTGSLAGYATASTTSAATAKVSAASGPAKPKPLAMTAKGVGPFALGASWSAIPAAAKSLGLAVSDESAPDQCYLESLTSKDGWSITLHGTPPPARGSAVEITGVEVSGDAGKPKAGTAPVFANGVTLGTPFAKAAALWPGSKVQTGEVGDRYVEFKLGTTPGYIDDYNLWTGNGPSSVVETLGVGKVSAYEEYCG